MQSIGDLAKNITLNAALRRIERKADIMRMDAQRDSPAQQDADEIRLLVGIALKCINE